MDNQKKEIFDGIFEKYEQKKYLNTNEKILINEIIKICLPTHHLSKPARLKEKIKLGEKMDKPFNPSNGCYYGHERAEILSIYNNKNRGCNQFAGKIQWLQLGRVVKEGAESATTFLHSKRGVINLYAYEQTDPV